MNISSIIYSSSTNKYLVSLLAEFVFIIRSQGIQTESLVPAIINQKQEYHDKRIILGSNIENYVSLSLPFCCNDSHNSDRESYIYSYNWLYGEL